MGIGLYKLAKNNDVQRAYLAWIPFANLYLMGKLAGKTSIFGWKIANIGLIVMILNLVTDVLLVLTQNLEWRGNAGRAHFQIIIIHFRAQLLF